jgi:UDP-N-acetylglucosamine:LPS N-acetylglucosamine transferase
VVVVPEPELDLRRQVDELLADPERLEKMGGAMKSLARPEAADDIAKELLRLAS